MQNVCDVLITDASGVVIPKVGIIQANILIEDGKIKDFAKSVENIQATKIINANGKVHTPRSYRSTCPLWSFYSDRPRGEDRIKVCCCWRSDYYDEDG